MKLETAIEILELNARVAGKRMPSDTLDAIKLGVEALKYRLELEQTDPEITLEPLPGETVATDSP